MHKPTFYFVLERRLSILEYNYHINGEKVRKKRKERYSSQDKFLDALSYHCAMSRGTLSDLENNKNPDITFTQVMAICNVLHCDIDYLLDMSDCSTKEIEAICNYTGLSEKTVQMLHDDNMKRDYHNPKISELLSELFDNTNSFIKLLYSLEQYIIYSVCDYYREEKANTGEDFESGVYELYSEQLESNILKSSKKTTQHIENIVDESLYNEYVFSRIEDVVSKPIFLKIKDVMKLLAPKQKTLKPSHPVIKIKKNENLIPVKEYTKNLDSNPPGSGEEIPF